MILLPLEADPGYHRPPKDPPEKSTDAMEAGLPARPSSKTVPILDRVGAGHQVWELL